MSRIRILFVLEATVGGAYKHVLLLAEYLPQQLFDVSVVLSPARNPDCIKDVARLEKKGVKCYFISMKRSISPYHDLKAIFKFCHHLRSNSYDIIHLHSSKAGIIGRAGAYMFGSSKIIYTPHCYHFQGKTGWQYSLYKKIEQLAALITDHIIVVSDSEKLLTEKERIISSSKIKRIFNGVNLLVEKENNGNNLKSEYHISPVHKVIIGVGRLTKQKDWATFIMIAHHVLQYDKEVTFCIAGDGEQKSMLQGLIDTYDISANVILLGNQDNMDRIYSMADIILNTSLWEGQSYAVLEAMKHKIPVIATDIPGNKDLVISGDNGILFSSRDIGQGASAVLSLLHDEVLREKMGSMGLQKLAAKHTLSSFIDQHTQFYIRCIKKTG